MKNFGVKWLAFAAAVGAVAGLSLNGCSDGGGGPAPSKGGSGGNSAGMAGSSAGQGGTTSTAGASGSAAAGRGGSAGSSAGSGGSAGGGGTAPALNCPVGTFNTALEGFQLNTYNTSAGNLVNREAGPKATAAFESGMGDPAAGSVKIDAPYDGYDQLVDLQKGWSATTLQNWTGATKLHVKVKVASGLNPNSAGIKGGVQPYVQTTSGYKDCRQWNNIPTTETGWAEYTLDFSTCAADWKINEVITVGVNVETGSGLLADAGVNPEKPTTAVIYVDSFWLEGTCGGGGGGTGGGAAGAGGSAAGAGGSAGAAGSTAGAGGATAGAGGSAGAAGSTAGAGGSNTDGGTTTAALLYTFDSSLQGFAIGTSGTGNIAAIDGGTPPTLTLDTAVGNPNNGSLKLTGTFTAYNQVLNVNSGIISPAVDLTGKTVHVWVRLDSGAANTGFTGGVQLQFLSTPGVYTFAQNNSQWVTLTAGTWTELTADMAAVKSMYSAFDPSQVIQVAVQFATGGQPDGGTFTTTSPTFHIDTISDGSGGSAPVPVNFTFASNLQGFGVTMTTPDGGTAPTITHDTAVGDPSAGSAKITVTFTDYGQSVIVSGNINPWVNLTGKTVTAKLRLDTGSGAFTAGYTNLFAASGASYVWGMAGGPTLTAGTWASLSLNADAAKTATPTFDPTQVRQVGVQIGTGNRPDGGTFGAATSLTFHLDTIVAP